MKKLARKFVPALLVLCLAAAARAQAPAPVPAAHVSVGSIDQITKLMADFGAPKFDFAKEIEGFLALGDGAIDTSKPGGVLILAGDSLPVLSETNAAQIAILAIPVKEGKVTPDTLKAAGAITVDGKPGIFKLSKFYYRRLGGYLLLQYNSTLGLAEIKDLPFANDYKTPGNLLVFSLDMAAVRKSTPDGMKQFFSTVDANIPPAANAAQAAGQKLGLSMIKTPIEKLEKLTVAIGQDDANIHLRSWITPMGPDGPAPKPVARPVFPASMLGQIHVAYPTGDSTAMIKSFIDAVPHEAFGGMDKEHEDKGRALALRVVKLFAGQQAVSMGVNMKGGAPVFYLVPQFANDVDFAAEAKAIIAAGKDLDGTDDKEPQPEVSTYDAGGKKITRVTMPGANGVIDCVAAGKVLYITISPADGKFVQEIADAGLSSKTSTLLCSGVLNLGAILDAAVQSGAPLPKEMQPELKKALDGQGITWTIQASENNTLFVDVALPKQVIRKGVDMMTGAGQGVDTLPPQPPVQ